MARINGNANVDDAPSLEHLFAIEADRIQRLAFTVGGLTVDLSKLPVPLSVLPELEAQAIAADLPAWRAKLAAGEIVNQSEGRAATHMALRDPANRAATQPMRELAERVRASDITRVIHIGIGGSSLGPALLVDALGDEGDGPEVRVVSNIDGVALTRALHGADPARTLIVAVSKTFTTLETMTNLLSALAWQEAAGIDDARSRIIAVTAAPNKAEAFGVQRQNILDFAESVGGRYSLWSAVGLPLAIRCGWSAFEALLDGAHLMDRHFMEAPFARNLPALLGAIDVWLANTRDVRTRGLFAYDERLKLLPLWLQQLEMESNGKCVTRDGESTTLRTSPIVWGGAGTDAQHAVFQLLHQGTHAEPIEFVAVAEPGHRLSPEHHRHLLANCFAQGAALMKGRSFEEALTKSGGDPVLARQKSFPGNRGSLTMLLDRLAPDRLGTLLALYEARVFAAAVLMRINPFDQWGVELGKEVANSIAAGGADEMDASTAMLMRAAGLDTAE